VVEVSGRALQDSRASETPRRHVPSPEPTYFVCGSQGPRRKEPHWLYSSCLLERCYSCRADEQGIRKTSMVQAKHNSPLVFPSFFTLCMGVWSCLALGFDNCKATFFVVSLGPFLVDRDVRTRSLLIAHPNL